MRVIVLILIFICLGCTRNYSDFTLSNISIAYDHVNKRTDYYFKIILFGEYDSIKAMNFCNEFIVKLNKSKLSINIISFNKDLKQYYKDNFLIQNNDRHFFNLYFVNSMNDTVNKNTTSKLIVWDGSKLIFYFLPKLKLY